MKGRKYMGSRNRENTDASRRLKRGKLAVCMLLAGMALLSMLAGCGLGSLSHDRFSSEAEAKALLYTRHSRIQIIT
ncbi:MAG: hypothetical protein IJ716_13240 [Lachnospiraceae bacterium]|nr:hypothetical protein [Lachnospiraceae bacterium]